MSARVLLGVLLISAVCLPVPAASGTQRVLPAGPGTSPGQPADGRAWLGWAIKAGHVEAYQGTQFVSSWSRTGTTSLLVELVHVPGEGTLAEVVPTVGNSGGRAFGASRPELADDLDPRPLTETAAMSSLDKTMLDLLDDNYELAVAGKQSCVGREAMVIEARRPDGAVAGRFWIDTATGLMLRREVLDHEGRTVRATAFVALDMGTPRLPARRPPSVTVPGNEWLGDEERDRLHAAGWPVLDALPAGLDLYDARGRGSGEDRVVHLSYSDGLSTISLFLQHGRLDGDGLVDFQPTKIGGHDVHVRQSLPQRVVWSGNDLVLTVLADAPPETLDAVVAALPHESADTSLLGKVGRGLARVVSWVNPFG